MLEEERLAFPARKVELMQNQLIPSWHANSCIQIDGHSLFQEVFFFCTVMNVGDIPGPRRIYVETVVDGNTGSSFAKVYSAKNSINAVDILASRVLPFYERQGMAIKKIHTKETSEYCGLVSVHPYETFLATSHIQHMPFGIPGQSYCHLCRQFYRLLFNSFFPGALRKTFQLSLNELQKDLDTFVDAYNAAQMGSAIEIEHSLPSALKIPVDL